jgi:hypothetical protein
MREAQIYVMTMGRLFPLGTTKVADVEQGLEGKRPEYLCYDEWAPLRYGSYAFRHGHWDLKNVNGSWAIWRVV